MKLHWLVKQVLKLNKKHQKHIYPLVPSVTLSPSVLRSRQQKQDSEGQAGSLLNAGV